MKVGMRKVKIGLAVLLLVGVALVGLTVMPSAHAATWKSVTATAYWKNVWGWTIVTTKLTQNWEYTGSKITWHSAPQYTWSKSWWAVWAYADGVKTGTWVEYPGWYNIGYGTAHYHAGIPTPWGAIGVNQDMYTKIGYYGNGDYWTASGFSYLG